MMPGKRQARVGNNCAGAGRREAEGEGGNGPDWRAWAPRRRLRRDVRSTRPPGRADSENVLPGTRRRQGGDGQPRADGPGRPSWTARPRSGKGLDRNRARRPATAWQDASARSGQGLGRNRPQRLAKAPHPAAGGADRQRDGRAGRRGGKGRARQGNRRKGRKKRRRVAPPPFFLEERKL